MKKNMIALALLALMGGIGVNAADVALTKESSQDRANRFRSVELQEFKGQLSDARDSDSVEEVIFKITDLKNAITRSTALLEDDREALLNEWQTLFESAESKKKELSSKREESENFSIRIQKLNAGSVPLSVNKNMTVYQLKDQIAKNGALGNLDIERQHLVYGRNALSNENTLASYNISAGATVHLIPRNVTPAEETAVKETSAVVIARPSEVVSTPKPQVQRQQQIASPKKMMISKPIDKMTSREIGALNYENLSAEQQEELMQMALFSGLESNRSAARKVIDAYRNGQRMDRINWDKVLADILAA